MLRPTKSQIEAEIIDCAAGLFAKHGFSHTSVQQIADTVGYSKTGLLHHFPSKQAIYDAVVKALREHAREVRDNVKSLPVGRARDLAVVEEAVDFSFRQPGVSALSNRIALDPNPEDAEMNEIGFMMYEALGIDMGNLDMERLIRVTSAFSGLGVCAGLATRTKLTQEWRGLIVTAAMDALGHSAT
ncbi:TetR/AcrR family transcriptional regulator [Rhizobium sp. X9]|uniref:TetR/AcrR family transcriptional regulator n=1 Tax=Rhizobium sp. X9 TaxID=2815360 RepID=UPI001C0E826F|nr:TetR/AcrR family transcriptional regulator [Rhizobium sp. X9]